MISNCFTLNTSNLYQHLKWNKQQNIELYYSCFSSSTATTSTDAQIEHPTTATAASQAGTPTGLQKGRSIRQTQRSDREIEVSLNLAN